ncbi:UDP-3-O-acyl-N-acetylglucosamine deacetylase [Breoghania sp.]|uniref:UDP-3-O-acyl-N-acetylglucosamine deacetylase n=1 Tax=Breoghania sp. TaxID=2065378 RepID=UPI00262F54B4|nr:UDP-3-O-acyl-N-acetylglucosamine deacetylase [Breoghania sp.]MDJ0931159.1 UDP-3-O-acyl-N-acetylglucosamine deacetylase [Breoghania sp.]
MTGLRNDRQKTLAERVTLDGLGVHSGKPVSMVLHPAPADNGITFIAPGTDTEIKAHWSQVSATSLCTVIGRGSEAIGTIEHLMAALMGLGIDNVVVEVDANEVPVMDGSSAQFVAAIDQAGLMVQTVARRYIRILKPIRVEQNGAVSEFRPYAGTRFDITIDFDTPLIGRQHFASDLTPDVFRKELARARTFGNVSDVEKLWAMGFAKGSSLENSVAISDGRVLNPEGTRWPDEFVRHKTLDAVGDLSLAGVPILGEYRSYKPGHKMNHSVLVALFADEDAYEMVVARPQREAALVDFSGEIAVPAYCPEVA